MLEDFKTMWDGYLKQMKTSRHQIELASDDIRPVRRALYRARPTTRLLAADEIDIILKEDVTKTTTTRQVSPIVLALKTTTRSDFASTQSEVTVRNVYSLPRVN